MRSFISLLPVNKLLPHGNRLYCFALTTALVCAHVRAWMSVAILCQHERRLEVGVEEGVGVLNPMCKLSLKMTDVAALWHPIKHNCQEQLKSDRVRSCSS